ARSRGEHGARGAGPHHPGKRAECVVSAPTIGLVERVRSRLAAAGGDTDLAVLAALRTLRQEFTGAGPLDELLRDPRTTDVLVCGPAGVWVDRGRGLERTAVRFTDDAAVRRLAQRL